MSATGWYDADGNYHEGPPPQPKKVAEPTVPVPSGWYDADGNYHEGPPPQPKKVAEPARSAPTGWYDAGGNYHEGLPPGIAAQQAAPQSPQPPPVAQAVQPAASAAPPPQVAPAIQYAPAAQAVPVQQFAATPAAAPAIMKPTASGGAKAAVITLTIALVATATALVLALLGVFTVPQLNSGGTIAATVAPQQITLVPAAQVGFTTWRAEPLTEIQTTVPDVLAKPASGPPSIEPVTFKATQSAGDTDNAYAMSPYTCRVGGFIRSAPDRIDAWAAALNTDPTLGWSGGELKPEDIQAYGDNLTAAFLLADTAVTVHGFASGAAFPTQSVLQAGTHVGVDRYGVPRVRCVSAEPLTAPASTNSDTAQMTGETWPEFDPAKVMVMEPTAAPLDSFEVRFVGAANTEGGTIAAGFTCAVGTACPAPGPGQVPADGVPPTGTVIPPAPAQCAPLGTESVTSAIVNLSAVDVVVSLVNPDTCSTTVENNWSRVLHPGQMLNGSFETGSLFVLGNGIDPNPIHTLEITESLVYANL